MHLRRLCLTGRLMLFVGQKYVDRYQKILLKPGVVFHQPQNWSLCQQHRGLIVSAGYSLNKVRPKLTPGKPTLAGNIATIRPSLLKTGPGKEGLLQLRAGADRALLWPWLPCLTNPAQPAPPLDQHCLKIRKIWPDVRRLAKISCC